MLDRIAEHPSRCRNKGAVQLPWGETYDPVIDDFVMVHVREAENGIACGCHCPHCHARLVANQGKIKQHYFSHYGPDRDCAGALETTLHKLAKEVIEANHTIELPAVGPPYWERYVTHSPTRDFRAVSVRLEVWQEGIRPDVVAFGDDGERVYELNIEIKVTHPCDDRKRAYLKEYRRQAIEIDLSGVSGELPRDVITQLVLRGADRRWLFNEAAQSEVDRQIADEQLRAAEAKRRLNVRTTALLAAYNRDDTGEDEAFFDHRDRVTFSGLDYLLDTDHPEGGSCFRGGPTHWQAMILDYFVLGRGPDTWHREFSVESIIDALVRRKLVKVEFEADLEIDVANAVRRLDPSFASARAAVEAFLRSLAAEGAVDKYLGHWRPEVRIADAARKRLAIAEEKARRVEALRRHVGMLVTESGIQIDIGSWMKTEHPGLPMSPGEVAITGGGELSALNNHLGRLRRMLQPDGEVVENLLGLPLEAYQEARLQEWEAAEWARLGVMGRIVHRAAGWIGHRLNR